ncbi:MAG: DUF6364 family protein [Bacteroidota bacterium]
MKTRVNLTIEEDVLREAKIYAVHHETSLSELTEDYLKSIVKKKKGKSILDLIKELPKPNVPADADLKKLYYEDSKHGG